jgi:hypothetical protein
MLTVLKARLCSFIVSPLVGESRLVEGKFGEIDVDVRADVTLAALAENLKLHPNRYPFAYFSLVQK